MYLGCEIEKQYASRFGGKEKSLESIVYAEEMTAQFAFLVKGFIVLTLSQLSLFSFRGLPLLCLHLSSYQELPEKPSTLLSVLMIVSAEYSQKPWVLSRFQCNNIFISLYFTGNSTNLFVRIFRVFWFVRVAEGSS